MSPINKEISRDLAEHFFRKEYGKLVSFITTYIGTDNVQSAEDIVQETLLKAVDFWQHNGIPKNPQAWLYTTAKNLTLNALKRKKHHSKFQTHTTNQPLHSEQLENLQISEVDFSDEQLKMMFVCCHPSISTDSQIALILKILCGFSISEIANAFLTSKETINKRLVRGRRQLRSKNLSFETSKNIDEMLPVVLRTIYLLFNEGYSPTQKPVLVRHDLCFEAIRLTEILLHSTIVKEKSDCHALLALMYLNASRFDARMNTTNAIIEMGMQDRKKWNQDLINKGIQNLNQAISGNQISTYLILAAISANHCVAPSLEKTDWKEILSLYDSLLTLQDTPTTRLNRSIALAKVMGNRAAIAELKTLESGTDLDQNYLLHAALAELYTLENDRDEAQNSYIQAISLAQNERDAKLLEKKLREIVPV